MPLIMFLFKNNKQVYGTATTTQVIILEVGYKFI